MLIAFSKTGELFKIRNFVDAKAKEFGFSDEQAQKISLAVDEACTNLIKHAYHFNISGEIRIRIDSRDNAFIVNILDEAPPFNPKNVKNVNLREKALRKEKGGLGVQIIRQLMDEINYTPSPAKGDFNKLKLVKYLD